MKPQVVVLVSNDLTYDKRVEKSCEIWRDSGWDVLLVGVKKKESIPLIRSYKCKRVHTFFSRGPGFYAILQIRLLFVLLFSRTNAIWANDLDTLLPAFLVSKLKRVPLYYDSHELFTEAEGLTGRNGVKRIWLQVEGLILPRLQYAFTVNQSIAEIYKKKYGIHMHVVRNVPSQPREPWKSQRSKLGLDENQKYVILQGAYIDPDRGAEELVMAAQLTTKFQVIVAGSGRAMEKLKILDSGNKVLFKPRMPYDELMSYTASCDLGVSLDKPLHDNYTYSLPNKLFDYWQAGLPVLVSPVVEVKQLVESELTGQVIESWRPEYLVQKIEGMLYSSQLVEWKRNAIKAAQQHCWEKESEIIRRQIRPFGLPK